MTLETDLFGEEAAREAAREADFYPTPLPVAIGFLERLKLPDMFGRILDPGAGSGNICKALRHVGWNGLIDAVELRDEETPALANITPKAPQIYIHDFLSWKTDKLYDMAIGNPPFSLAQEFAEKCFGLADRTALLLRLGFLCTKKRCAFWDKHPYSSIYYLINRPSFTGNGTDSQEYAWFVWGGPEGKFWI